MGFRHDQSHLSEKSTQRREGEDAEKAEGCPNVGRPALAGEDLLSQSWNREGLGANWPTGVRQPINESVRVEDNTEGWGLRSTEQGQAQLNPAHLGHTATCKLTRSSDFSRNARNQIITQNPPMCIGWLKA